MERIKQAIDKARRERGAEPVPPVSMDAPRPRAGDDELLNLRYEHTRSISLDPAHLRAHRIVAFEKNNTLSMPFDMLRTQLLQVMAEHDWRTVAITSPTPESGKTVVSINLALSVAHQTNRTAILVDFDFRRPRVADYLGLQPQTSLNEVLGSGVPMQEALLNPGVPRLVVLPTRSPIARSAELLGSNRVQALVSEIRQRYESRIAIFDLPPLLNADDAISILPEIDCVVLVVANGRSTRREIESSLALLRGSNLAGVLMNMADQASQPHYY